MRDLDQTARWVVRQQRPDGAIPWWRGGRVDSWNQIEAAMGLDVAGFHEEAARAYLWLRAHQRSDGAWPAAVVGSRVEDPTLDANFAAYIAVGVWHHWLCTRDLPFVIGMWPTVQRGIAFALDLQSSEGSIYWARDARLRAWPEALLTSSSCVALSLRCALSLADLLGADRPDWELSLTDLLWALRHNPGAFADRSRYAMDWYYPVLCGVLGGEQAEVRIEEGWGSFVIEGRGARCVSDRPWVTAAETCELVVALCACGRFEEASALFEWIQHLRRPDGSYWTGATHPGGVVWPREATTWTAGAALLAADALWGLSAACSLFAEPAPVQAAQPAREEGALRFGTG